MSIFALLPAVRDTIRLGLSLDANQCRVRPEAKPPPACGDVFVSVFGLSWTPGDPDLNRGIDEFYGVGVALTQRCAWIQDEDRAEELFIKTGCGMDVMIRKINALIHQSIPVMQAANKLIASDVNQIVEPLRWQSADATPSLVGGDWFSAASSSKDPRGDQTMGMVLQTNFDRARRPQTLANMR